MNMNRRERTAKKGDLFYSPGQMPFWLFVGLSIDRFLSRFSEPPPPSKTPHSIPYLDLYPFCPKRCYRPRRRVTPDATDVNRCEVYEKGNSSSSSPPQKGFVPIFFPPDPLPLSLRDRTTFRFLSQFCAVCASRLAP